MALISLRDISMSFGDRPVLDGVDLQIEAGERLCLLGLNGSGKTTLMKIIAGEMEALGGEIQRSQGLVASMLDQKVPDSVFGTVFSVISSGAGKKGQLVQEYHKLAGALADSADDDLLRKLDNVQHRLEAENAWDLHNQAEKLISDLGLDGEAEFSTLSAGLKRRTLLGRALVVEPDLLMLDEPTNHLDIESIAFLENFLLNYGVTLLFVTHDRTFLRKLSTRIITIDNGQLSSWGCDYDTYLKRKDIQMQAMAKEHGQFDKKLSSEEAWIRKGIKARRTRNEGRVRALEKMREMRKQRRSATGKVRFAVQDTQLSGRLVIEAKNVCFSYGPESGEENVISDFSSTIFRGDKIGIIGPNGCGKSTLLGALLKKLKPQHGSVRHGTKLEIAYYDQLGMQLDEDKTVWENVGEDYNTIVFNGESMHVLGYLQNFLFTPEKAKSRLSNLSGGERNRVLLAKLFSKPANLLVLDEPTNDLDIETLELLEEILVSYKGSVLMVSHDRSFLNNITTSIIAFEDGGLLREYTGGYDDYLRQKEPVGRAVKKEKPAGKPKAAGKKKLSYKEKRELEGLVVRLEELEREQKQLHETMADPVFYKQESGHIAATVAKAEAVDKELDQAFQRWEELEELNC
ncbi:MAG: ATP-binding cassette domain-containing protein [Planctomycetes bacterium]|nr:ATP-binding cassette domain-containing protein [Planctomycetota bacterium]